MTELEAIASRARVDQPDVDVVLPELRRRVRRYRDVLSEETTEARQMLRTLMKTRMVFTPNVEEEKVTFEARGHYGELFAGLIHLPSSIGVASPTGTRDTYEPGTRESHELPLSGTLRKAA
jgi:hypothetical protein